MRKINSRTIWIFPILYQSKREREKVRIIIDIEIVNVYEDARWKKAETVIARSSYKRNHPRNVKIISKTKKKTSHEDKDKEATVKWVRSSWIKDKN